jgi:hypothetical protein
MSSRHARILACTVIASSALACATSAPVLAGKPSSSKAIRAAQAWRRAMNTEKSPAAIDAAVARSGLPFWYVPRPPLSESDARDTCGSADRPLANDAALRPVLDCVMEHGGLIDDAAYGPQAATWKVIAPGQVPAPLKPQARQLASLGTDHVLVLETLSIPAPATEWVVYVIASGNDGMARVDGVLRAGRDDSMAQP